MENKKEKVKRQRPGIPVKTGLIGLILLAFYALFNYNPFGQPGSTLSTNRQPDLTQSKDVKEEYIFKIRNKIILVNNEEKQFSELHGVLLEIKKKQGAVQLLKNGEEKSGFINEVREELKKNNILFSESWEPGTEPK
ncbi:MAG: hypothetical protein AABZ60_08475 [Planctomycetota bacterium]